MTTPSDTDILDWLINTISINGTNGLIKLNLWDADSNISRETVVAAYLAAHAPRLVPAKKTFITLESLIGLHTLKGVDTNIPPDDPDKQVDSIRFKLDNKVYEGVEDPNDGYRSSMDHISETTNKVKNTFRGVKVLARMAEPRSSSDILELISLKTGKVVLRVGTENIDDYYPSWEATFCPENL